MPWIETPPFLKDLHTCLFVVRCAKSKKGREKGIFVIITFKHPRRYLPSLHLLFQIKKELLLKKTIRERKKRRFVLKSFLTGSKPTRQSVWVFKR